MEKAAGQGYHQGLYGLLDMQRHVQENLGTETNGYWIYTAVVRSIVTYAAAVWWPRVKVKTSQAELGKLQRMACLGTTGALRTAPTVAMINGNPNLKVLDMHT
jgi:hypothetical protein